MQQNIEELVTGILRELEFHGLTPSTIRQYKRGFYQPIIKFFNSSNSGKYSTETFESCIKAMKLHIQMEKSKDIFTNP